MPNINIMTNEERIERNAYFIGELALALRKERIRIQYDTLRDIILDKFGDKFAKEAGGLPRAVYCTKGRWKTESKHDEVCAAIDFVYQNSESCEPCKTYEEIKPIVEEVITKIEEDTEQNK